MTYHTNYRNCTPECAAACQHERNKASKRRWAAENRERMSIYTSMRKYGLTEEDATELRQLQNKLSEMRKTNPGSYLLDPEYKEMYAQTKALRNKKYVPVPIKTRLNMSDEQLILDDMARMSSEYPDDFHERPAYRILQEALSNYRKYCMLHRPATADAGCYCCT